MKRNFINKLMLIFINKSIKIMGDFDETNK